MYPTILPIKRLISLVCSILTSYSFQCCETELDECFFLEDKQIIRSFDLANFNQIVSYLPGEYTIKQADFHRIEVAGHQYYIDSLSTHVKNNKVYLHNTIPFCQAHTTFSITIYMTDLNDLYVSDRSNINVEDFKNQSDLNISLTKKSFLEINRFEGLRNFYAELSREAEIAGSSKLDTLDQISIRIGGRGRFNGFKFPAKKVNIDIQGKGYCEVNAIEKLSVVIKGEANVYSKGMPSLYKRITGKGNVYFSD